MVYNTKRLIKYVNESAMAGVAFLIILHEILSKPLALLLRNQLSNW